MYAVIDIETTGLNPQSDRIIEVAIYIMKNGEVVNEFNSLVNPERIITANITSLTGITNEMVANAPKFWEIAKDIVMLTDGMTFVAHNANFDYNFIKNEFKQLGYEFRKKKLCTVKLSKRLLPGHRSYSLGKLCEDLNIQINGRHRAAGDALATCKLFSILLETEKNQKTELYNLPVDKSILDSLPEETGVYYFHNDQNEVIYIGKSTNIRSRVLSHFNNGASAKAQKMTGEIKDISYELTGSELIALLLESAEIKGNKPKYNRAQRRNSYNYGIYSFIDDRGYINLGLDNTSNDNLPIISYPTLKETRERLFKLCEDFELCQKLCGLYESAGFCFYFSLDQCKGACGGEEAPESYNERVEKALASLSFEWQNFFIIDEGRNISERSVVQIENGKYLGYGYFDIEMGNINHEFLAESVEKMQDNKDVRQIIRTHLKKKKVEKIISY